MLWQNTICGWQQIIRGRRLDILFSQLKYNDIYYVMDGGWHFTNARKPEDLEKKFRCSSILGNSQQKQMKNQRKPMR